ncbi:hypothetical protein MAPG_09875 [Magnaporthiopsis poae ATCC 64411]|uniref:Uncharacterized protein n=1 Tax=Magnaporthiopsis poae (strain ATCC 64411 / 73-15) TaxID=644358 RepID=A0A0C4EB32_MAGP6|nr:hypothetical protein MAPG_09875 [Magnaporthiopsis poae ATCC 64411]
MSSTRPVERSVRVALIYLKKFEVVYSRVFHGPAVISREVFRRASWKFFAPPYSGSRVEAPSSLPGHPRQRRRTARTRVSRTSFRAASEKCVAQILAAYV